MFFRKRRKMFYKYCFKDKDDCVIYIEFFIWSDFPFEIILHHMYRIQRFENKPGIYASTDTDMQRDCILWRCRFKIMLSSPPSLFVITARFILSESLIWLLQRLSLRLIADIVWHYVYRQMILEITHINCNWSVEAHDQRQMFYLFCSGHIIGIVCMHYIFGNVFTGRSTSNVSENCQLQFPWCACT